LDEALELARQALSQQPNVATFHDTLGTILLLQGKHLEAVKEFEIALVENSNDKTLHGKLAQANEALGNLEIAKMHRARSQ
jgi:predicted Zn-dependent protease